MPILAYEKDAILFAVNHFLDIGLMGWIVGLKGTIGAISVVGPVNEDMAVVHFEKALPETYQGILPVITTGTAAALLNPTATSTGSVTWACPGSANQRRATAPPTWSRCTTQPGTT